jgi:hypothetical protein
MRTGVDALRSIHRYVWKAVENDVPPLWQDEARSWEVRMWGSEGTFGFPFARVAAITPVTYSGPASWREAARTFAVHLYPVPMSDPEASLMEVERVEEILAVAFETGFEYLDQPDPADASTWSRVTSTPHRIPLYDYEGVPLDGPNAVSYVRGPNDFLRVVSCPINRIVDPEDDTYWLVTAEPRVTWRRTGRQPVAGPLVTSVRTEFTETV